MKSDTASGKPGLWLLKVPRDGWVDEHEELSPDELTHFLASMNSLTEIIEGKQVDRSVVRALLHGLGTSKPPIREFSIRLDTVLAVLRALPRVKRVEAPNSPTRTAGSSAVLAPTEREDRRAAVEAYIEEVYARTTKRITRTDIWKMARYRTRTEFERWERNDKKNPNKTADARFKKILTEKPHLK